MTPTVLQVPRTWGRRRCQTGSGGKEAMFTVTVTWVPVLGESAPVISHEYFDVYEAAVGNGRRQSCCDGCLTVTVSDSAGVVTDTFDRADSVWRKP